MRSSLPSTSAEPAVPQMCCVGMLGGLRTHGTHCYLAAPLSLPAGQGTRRRWQDAPHAMAWPVQLPRALQVRPAVDHSHCHAAAIAAAHAATHAAAHAHKVPTRQSCTSRGLHAPDGLASRDVQTCGRMEASLAGSGAYSPLQKGLTKAGASPFHDLQRSRWCPGRQILRTACFFPPCCWAAQAPAESPAGLCRARVPEQMWTQLQDLLGRRALPSRSAATVSACLALLCAQTPMQCVHDWNTASALSPGQPRGSCSS